MSTRAQAVNQAGRPVNRLTPHQAEVLGRLTRRATLRGDGILRPVPESEIGSVTALHHLARKGRAHIHHTDCDTVFVTVEQVMADEGSVVVFSGRDDMGGVVRFAVDHRYAADLIEAVEIDGDIEVELEGWQILGRQP